MPQSEPSAASSMAPKGTSKSEQKWAGETPPGVWSQTKKPNDSDWGNWQKSNWASKSGTGSSNYNR